MDGTVMDVKDATVVETRFAASRSLTIPDRTLTTVALSLDGPDSPHLECTDGRIHFRTVGWYEVLLAVDWQPDARSGTRFSHTMVPDHEPLHSEAIDADVLVALNGGKQRLRGNTIFGLPCTGELELGVWQDCGESIALPRAELVVRELSVPWTPTVAPSQVYS